MTDYTSEGHKLYPTTSKSYMPIVAPVATNRLAYYNTAYAAMSLATSSPAGTTIYSFTIDASVNGDYKKLFMMFKGVLWYYPAGKTLPDGNVATDNTIVVQVYRGATASWSSAFPGRGSVAWIADLTYSNFDETTLKTYLLPLITANLSDKLMRKRYKATTGSDYAGTTLAEDYFNLFMTGANIAIPVNGAEQIADLKKDNPADPSSSIYRLDMTFKTTDDQWSNTPGIKEFFEYWQRMQGTSGEMMSGHPMIAHIRGIDPAASMVDLTDHDSGYVDKYFNSLGVDPEAAPVTLVVPSLMDPVTIAGVTYPADSGNVSLTIYNPGGATLVVESGDPTIFQVSTSEITGTTTITVFATTASGNFDTLSIYRKADAIFSTNILLKQVGVLILEPRAVPLMFLKVKDSVQEADDSVLTELIERVNELLGKQACVYIYPLLLDETSTPIAARLSYTNGLGTGLGTLGDVISIYTDATHTTMSAEFYDLIYRDLQPSLADLEAKLWCILIWNAEYHEQGSSLEGFSGFNIADGSWDYPLTFIESGTTDIGWLAAHEICHSIATLASQTPTGDLFDEETYKHFSHASNGAGYIYPDMDCLLDHNLMQPMVDSSGLIFAEDLPRLTSRQARLLNAAAAFAEV